MFIINPHLAALSPPVRAEVEGRIERFEQAWRDGGRPAIDDHLPAGGPERVAVLVELVHAELECRLLAGEPARVEEYLDRYPALAADPALAAALVLAEYHLRPGRNGTPRLGEYLKRFPQYAQEIAAGAGDPQPALRPWDPSATPFPATRTLRRDGAAGPAGTATCGRLGKFDLLEIVGRGSFGVVYRAWDGELKRTVAVKVSRLGELATPAEADRFRREARSAARLSHPGIVALHDAGQWEGRNFLVSEFVPGTTLAKLLQEERPTIRAAAELVAAVADALDFAHRQGVIHRDVKPSNILLDEAGRPHVADFGLAKADQGSASLTAPGEILGTPAYMAPEQARGDSHLVDGRGDVYSLGVILYEMLTGEVPFRGTSQAVFRQVLEEEPRPPRRLNEGIPRDLETVCLKALAKEPAGRYASAGALAEDLRRFLQGRPVMARPVGRLARLGRWARRKPLLAGLAAALLLVTVLGFTGVAWQWHVAEQQRRQAEANLREAERQRQKARKDFQQAHAALTDLVRTNLRGAPREVPPSDPVLARALRYYQDFLRERGDEPFLAVEAATAEASVAAITRARNHKHAVAAYHKARDRWSRVVQEYPGVAELEYNLAECLLNLAQSHLRVKRWAEAVPFFEQGLTRLEHLARAHPAEVKYQFLLAASNHDLGLTLLNLGRGAAALRCWHRTADLAERLAARTPDAAVSRVLLAQTYHEAAALQYQLGDRRGALRSYRRSLPLLEKLCGPDQAVGPTDEAYQDYYWYSAMHRVNQQALSGDRPDPLALQSYLAKTHFWIGALSSHAGRHREALHSFRRAAQTFGSLARALPGAPSHRRDLAASYHCLGNLLCETGRPAEAVLAYAQALVHRRALHLLNPKDPVYASDLRGTWQRLGQALGQLGWREAGQAAYRQAAVLARARAGKNGPNGVDAARRPGRGP